VGLPTRRSFGRAFIKLHWKDPSTNELIGTILTEITTPPIQIYRPTLLSAYEALDFQLVVKSSEPFMMRPGQLLSCDFIPQKSTYICDEGGISKGNQNCARNLMNGGNTEYCDSSPTEPKPRAFSTPCNNFTDYIDPAGEVIKAECGDTLKYLTMDPAFVSTECELRSMDDVPLIVGTGAKTSFKNSLTIGGSYTLTDAVPLELLDKLKNIQGYLIGSSCGVVIFALLAKICCCWRTEPKRTEAREQPIPGIIKYRPTPAPRREYYGTD
jgi:hypothetical protein